MSILVKVCYTDLNDGQLIERRPISLGRRLFQQQLTQGSFGLFSLYLNPNIRRFDPKSSDFSQFKPKNITKTYLSQIINHKHRKLEARKEKKVKNPSSRTQQSSSSSSPKFEYLSVNFISRHVEFH